MTNRLFKYGILVLLIGLAFCEKETQRDPTDICPPINRGQVVLVNNHPYEIDLWFSISGGGVSDDSTAFMGNIQPSTTQTVWLRPGLWHIFGHSESGQAPHAHNEWDFDKDVLISPCAPITITYPF